MSVKPLNTILVVIGLVLVSLNLGLGVYATGQVAAAVEEAVATKVKDDICEDTLCTSVVEDWKESTSQRSFYAWHITNVDDVSENGVDPVYEKIGPITYDVTLNRDVDNYDIKNGLLTYSQTTSYACSEDTEVPCSTEISQLNIAFNAQVVGATGTAVNAIMGITKTGFASGVLDILLQKGSAAYAVADEIENEHMALLGSLEGPGSAYIVNTNTHNSAESYFLDGMFEAFNDAYGDAFLDDDTKTFLGEGFVEPLWVDGDWNDDGDGILEEDELWYYDNNGNLVGDLNENGIIDNESSSFISSINLEYAFYNAVGPDGEDLSLINYMGPLVYAAMGEPESYEEIVNNPEDSVTLERAEMWNFAHPTDLNITLSRDWTLYGGLGKLMLDYGAGNDDYKTDYSEDDVNLSTRVLRLMDVDLDDDVAKDFLTLGDGTDEPLGILAVSESGTSFGLTEYLEMNQQTAIETYGLTAYQHQNLKAYASDWAEDRSVLPQILLGGEGYITASEFVNQTFGAENPIDGEYMQYSLNQEGRWGSGIDGFPTSDPINLTQEESANILFGEWGLTTRKGASMFLYGELSGKTLPINYSNDNEIVEQEDWTDEFVASIYEIDVNAAAATRMLVMDEIFKNFVPDFLIDSFGTSMYLTQPMNNWLLGWHDPVNAYLATGDSENMTAGWTSLEANETFYGSGDHMEGGKSTGDPALVTICTGEVDTCDKGETVQVGDDEYVSWKNTTKEENTYRLITAEKQQETTGGFLTGDGDLVDLAGYGYAEIECSSEGFLKGVPVDICEASMDPLSRSIQAKLVNSGELLDAIPGVLPVYFGSEVTMKAEKISGAIIGGESQSIFWLDTRETTNQREPPTQDDLQEVFMIQSSAELDDETAEAMESQIVTNQDQFAYFTNFDHWIDYVTLSIWIVGLTSILLGAGLILKDTKSSTSNKWSEPEDSTPKMDADEDEMETSSNESKQEVD